MQFNNEFENTLFKVYLNMQFDNEILSSIWKGYNSNDIAKSVANDYREAYQRIASGRN